MNNGYSSFIEIHNKVVSDIENVVESDCWWTVYDSLPSPSRIGIENPLIYDRQN